MNKTTEALKMAIKKAITELEVLSSFPQYDLDYVDMIKELRGCLNALESQEQKPMTTTDVITCSMSGKCCMTGETIYTHPAQPLSDDEIMILLNEIKYSAAEVETTFDYEIRIARAIEAYHGIGVKDAN